MDPAVEALNADTDVAELPRYTPEELARHNGVVRPELYVAIRGVIYDVSHNQANYGPGKAYHQFAGRDVSRLLALNRFRMKPEDVVEADAGNTWFTGDLGAKQNAIVDKWVDFFRKRYRIVGVVRDQVLEYVPPPGAWPAGS